MCEPRFPFITTCPLIERVWSNVTTLMVKPSQLAVLVGTSERTIQRAIVAGMPAVPVDPKSSRKRWLCHVGQCVEWLHQRQWLYDDPGRAGHNGGTTGPQDAQNACNGQANASNAKRRASSPTLVAKEVR